MSRDIKSIFKSLLLTLGVVIISGLIVLSIAQLDSLWGLPLFSSVPLAILGIILLLLGILMRFWASYAFYQEKLKVIALATQHALITKGPYKFSRNPLFLGIILIYLGLTFLIGSSSALVFSILAFIFFNIWVYKEEKELEASFDQSYFNYKSKVRRWL